MLGTNTFLAGQELLLEEKKEELLQEKAKAMPYAEIRWEHFLINYRHLDIKILEIIYLPSAKPLTFHELYSRIKKMNFCSKTIRRRLKKIEDDGLVKIFNSTITFINPIIELEKNIQNLTMAWEARNKLI